MISEISLPENLVNIIHKTAHCLTHPPEVTLAPEGHLLRPWRPCHLLVTDSVPATGIHLAGPQFHVAELAPELVGAVAGETVGRQLADASVLTGLTVARRLETMPTF